MNSEIIVDAYKIIGGATPLKSDCGLLCEHACCLSDDDGKGGVYLFPGEEELLKECGWGETVKDDFAPMLVCENYCEREKRPLACRIFPLTPVFNDKGLTVRIDARARAVCPLAHYGIKGMDSDFLRKVRDALKMIDASEEGHAFLEKWQQLEEQYRDFRL